VDSSSLSVTLFAQGLVLQYGKMRGWRRMRRTRTRRRRRRRRNRQLP
jgi:hypothetical protein